MSRLALVNSETLIGKELKEALRGRSDLATDVRLLTSDIDEVGAVTEGVDGAAFVQELTPASLDDTNVVILCPGPQPVNEAILPADGTILYINPPHPINAATVLVAGVNLEQVTVRGTLVSPHPAAVALALLLDPLRQYGLEQAACWALLPASEHGQEGVDELLEQTRSLLTFQPDKPTAVFGQQLAFNLLPAVTPAGELARQISDVLAGTVMPSVQAFQAGTFHSLAVAAHVRLTNPPTARHLTAELLERPGFDETIDPCLVGPVAAAGRNLLLLGPVEETSGPRGTLTLWAAMDNLTIGYAGNVIGILEALLAPRH